MPKFDNARITAKTGAVSFIEGGDSVPPINTVGSPNNSKVVFPHNIYGFYPTGLVTGQTIFRILVVNRIRFASNFEGSVAICDTAATADTLFFITVSENVVGTLHFEAGATHGTFDSSGEVNLIPGDMLQMTLSPEGTSMLGLSFTLKGAIIG